MKRVLCLLLLPIALFATQPVHHPVSKVGQVNHAKAKIKTTTKAKGKTHKKHSTAPVVHHSPALESAMLQSQSLVCQTAESQLGKPYVWGGDSPEDGFDCSGFSQYVYETQGINIPRTAAAQFHSLTPIRMADLQQGDLVFFKTHGKRKISHVGIYIGQGEFIHSPRTGKDIQIDNLKEAYWHKHYAGARRAISWNYAAAHFNNSTRFMNQLSGEAHYDSAVTADNALFTPAMPMTIAGEGSTKSLLKQ